MGDGWYKRYPSDFIAGTLHMTLEEKGAYSICLDLMYANNGFIVDDPHYISHVCHCSVRKWKAIRSKLIEYKKIIESDGHLTNDRVTLELSKNPFHREKKLENSSKVRRKTSEKRVDPNNNNDLRQVEAEAEADNHPKTGGKRRRATKPPTPCPADFYPKEKTLDDLAQKFGFSRKFMDDQVFMMINWAHSIGLERKDWEAQFRNWIAKKKEWAEEDAAKKNGATSPDGEELFDIGFGRLVKAD